MYISRRSKFSLTKGYSPSHQLNKVASFLGFLSAYSFRHLFSSYNNELTSKNAVSVIDVSRSRWRISCKTKTVIQPPSEITNRYSRTRGADINTPIMIMRVVLWEAACFPSYCITTNSAITMFFRNWMPVESYTAVSIDLVIVKVGSFARNCYKIKRVWLELDRHT